MNPKPSTYANTIRARRHPLWHREVGEPRPHTGLIHTEHCEVLWLYIRDVALVGDGKRAAFDVVNSGCVILRDITSWANIVTRTDIAAFRRGEVRCCALLRRQGGGEKVMMRRATNST